MKTLIIFSLSSTYRPRSVMSSLALDEQSAGNEVSVLDVSDFSFITQDLPPRWFARLFGQAIHTPNLPTFLRKHGVSWQVLQQTQPFRELPDEAVRQREAAVESEVITYLRTDRPQPGMVPHARIRKNIADAASPLYWALRDFLDAQPFDKVLIPNGRVAHQRLAILAAVDAGLEIEYYEIGRALPFSYYRGPHQVHDREGTQDIVRASTAHLSDEQCSSLAMTWLGRRMATDSEVNVYSKGWKEQEQRETKESAAPIAVFFSSSVDEFASYGSSWQNHDWSDQYAAFDAILARLSPRGIPCVLRVHPNLINKGREYFRREVTRISELQSRYPHLRVHWHTDDINSYALVEQADYVFVGRSTLGLEASCLGKSVWVTTSARYDQTADVRMLLSQADLDGADLSPWAVNPRGAQRFVASWVTQDHLFSIHESQWCTWDSAKAPLMMKIGNLLVKNSWHHRMHLLRLELIRVHNIFDGKRLERHT